MMKAVVSPEAKAATIAATLVSERYETTPEIGIRKVITKYAREMGQGGDALVYFEVKIGPFPQFGMVQFLWRPDGTLSSVIWWSHDSVQ